MKLRKSRNRKETGARPPEQPRDKITQLLDIPASALAGMPQIELSGNREAVVEGCQGILEYDENIIRLSTGKMSIRFTGRNLQIKVLTHTSAVVDGFITGIEFLT